MAKKYSVIPGKEWAVIIASKPQGRRNGIYELNKCSQADLKYLHDVVMHPYVMAADVRKKEK